MGEGIEDKINNKQVILSFKDIKWVVAIIVTVIGWGVTGYLWISDKSEMKEEIITLQTDNKSLSESVIRLEGQIEGVNNASEIFMKNSPSENRYRIEKLEHDMEVLKKPGQADPEDFIVTTSEMDTTNVIERSGPSNNLSTDND